MGKPVNWPWKIKIFDELYCPHGVGHRFILHGCDGCCFSASFKEAYRGMSNFIFNERKKPKLVDDLRGISASIFKDKIDRKKEQYEEIKKYRLSQKRKKRYARNVNIKNNG